MIAIGFSATPIFIGLTRDPHLRIALRHILPNLGQHAEHRQELRRPGTVDVPSGRACRSSCWSCRSIFWGMD
jgi:hypothetical protein